MSMIEHAARLFRADQSKINLRRLLAAVDDADNTEDRAAYMAAARVWHHEDGQCEIDGDATVSLSSDGGAYVQAWVWVDQEDMEIEKARHTGEYVKRTRKGAKP
jgi:hypothetical protein